MNLFHSTWPGFSLHWSLTIGHFTVMVGSEGEGDLVLIQTFFALLWKLFLKNTSKHKNNLIYIIKQEGLYQDKVTLSLASIHNCKMAYSFLLQKLSSFSLFLSMRIVLKCLICWFSILRNSKQEPAVCRKRDFKSLDCCFHLSRVAK